MTNPQDPEILFRDEVHIFEYYLRLSDTRNYVIQISETYDDDVCIPENLDSDHNNNKPSDLTLIQSNVITKYSATVN